MSTQNDVFVSADQLSTFIGVAKIYLLQRKADYEQFCSEFKLSFRPGSGIVHSFQNGYEAHIYNDGSVALVWPDCNEGKHFPSFEQFAAYWLARFW